MYNWIGKTVVYSLCNATIGLSKKKGLQTVNESSYLLGYSLFTVLFVCPFFSYAKSVDTYAIMLMLLKSILIFIGWNCAVRGIQHVTLSVYGAMDSFKLVFTHALAIAFVGEALTWPIVIGSIIVIIGIQIFSMKKDDDEVKKSSKRATALLLVNAFANASAGIIDKLSAGHGHPIGLLYFFAWFTAIFCVIAWAFTKSKQGLFTIVKVPWIWIGSIAFTLGDLNLYFANVEEGSSAMLIAIIKTASLLWMILFSFVFFKEKKIWYNLGAAALIIAGIVLTTVF